MKEKTTVIRIGVLIVALALLVAGIIDGGFGDVMNKATRICYECIGIG